MHFSVNFACLSEESCINPEPMLQDVSLSKQRSLLDFSDLNLLLFWDFYRKLRSM